MNKDDVAKVNSRFGTLLTEHFEAVAFNGGLVRGFTLGVLLGALAGAMAVWMFLIWLRVIE